VSLRPAAEVNACAPPACVARNAPTETDSDLPAISLAIGNGILFAMRTTIDKAGRVVVPKPLRQAIGLGAGSEVEIRVSDGRIEMEPAPLEVRLERKGDVLVAVPLRPVPGMSAALVKRTIASVRARPLGRRRAR